MARTRAQRRKQNLVITAGLAITLLVLVFARDVSSSAHNSTSPRKSENRSFGVMANALLTEENAFDARLAFLINTGSTLSRPVFAARLDQLNQELPQWSVLAQQLARPILAHHVNDVLATSTQSRVDDYQVLLSDLAQQLSLPWPKLTEQSITTAPIADLNKQTTMWNTSARFSLQKEPGRVHLDALNNVASTLSWQPLLHSTSLAATRGIGIAAVEITPTPLPATAGTLLLAPTNQVQVAVSVRNASYVNQPVTLTLTLTPTNGVGRAHSESVTGSIGPSGSFAFVPPPLGSLPAERASLTISLNGAPSAPGLSLSRHYKVVISPSGNG